jgi:hypothetical protein
VFGGYLHVLEDGLGGVGYVILVRGRGLRCNDGGELGGGEGVVEVEGLETGYYGGGETPTAGSFQDGYWIDEWKG